MSERPASRSAGTRTLLSAMLREEWRLHSELFGGRRFAAFPLVILALGAGAFALLFETGTDPLAVVGGLHAVVAFFGLQVGTIGLVGRDAMRNVLGEVTLLVFTSRTLPLSWRRLLAVFLLKDLIYYSGLFLAPLAVAYTPLALGVGESPARILLLWVTLTGAFTLGVGVSLTLVGLASRSRGLLLGTLAAVAVGFVVTGIDPIGLTPYATYAEPSAQTLVAGFGPTLALAVVGPLTFQPIESDRGRRRTFPAATITAYLPDHYGLARRALLDVSRSSGSIWKVIFSMGVLFVIAGLLLVQIADATGLDPAAGIAFGTLLGLGGFTTYAWLTQFDDTSEYLRYPITIGDVLAGKRLAYLVLVLPVGVLYLAIAAIWFPVSELALGLVVFPLIAVYVYGLTAYVAGMSPTELLFDTPLFMLFGAGLSVVSVPLLVAALAYSRGPTIATAVALGVAVLAAGAGVVLGRRAGARWDAKLRT